MKDNRRDFLRISGLGGRGLVSGSILSCKNTNEAFAVSTGKARNQRFNMSGYAAPRLETVRIGFIGLGMRDPGAVNRMSKIEGVEIQALCDLRPSEVEKVGAMLRILPIDQINTPAVKMHAKK